MARESARRNSCANNLRQAALATKLHIDAHGTFPTGGWGADWVGDPDAGFGKKQPGGWIYNVLPYLEGNNVRAIGQGLQGGTKQQALVQLMQTPLSVFNCPSRRAARLYPYSGPAGLRNAQPPEEVAKSDYVINKRLSFEKSQVMLGEIQLSQGLSNTILAGEKSLARTNYSDGKGAGDTLTMYVGDSSDIARAVGTTVIPDVRGNDTGFGSPHPGGCNFVFCDASVRFVTEDESLKSN